MHKQQLGQAGEQALEQWLEQRGFAVLAKNFTTRVGEIDVVAQKDDVIAFIEAKTRNQAYFPIASVVNRSKQKKIIKTAKLFVLKNNIKNKVLRFDIAAILVHNGQYNIDYIADAFRCS